MPAPVTAAAGDSGNHRRGVHAADRATLELQANRSEQVSGLSGAIVADPSSEGSVLAGTVCFSAEPGPLGGGAREEHEAMGVPGRHATAPRNTTQ